MNALHQPPWNYKSLAPYTAALVEGDWAYAEVHGTLRDAFAMVVNADRSISQARVIDARGVTVYGRCFRTGDAVATREAFDHMGSVVAGRLELEMSVLQLSDWVYQRAVKEGRA